MLARNVTVSDLEHALAVTNARFGGNVKFRDIRQVGKNVRFTLAVNDSRGCGAHLAASGRHTASACWHAHGTFFDALPAGATIIANGKKIHPGDEWQDWNMGSNWYPHYASELCEC